MNHLNSILIEGEVSEILKSEKTEGKKSTFIFNINSHSVKRLETEDVEEVVNTFEVKCTGKLAEACINHLTVGRGVRIVGKLAITSGKKKSVYIQSEHAEFKPVIKPSTEAE